MPILSDNFKGYVNIIRQLAVCFEEDLWIVGGWVRNQNFFWGKYAGDVDLVTTKGKLEIEKLLICNFEFVIHRTALGGCRVYLDDKNHIDIFSIEEFSDKSDLNEALTDFNFSINSVAVNLASCQVVYSDNYLEDFSSSVVRLNNEFPDCVSNLIPILKDFDVMLNYYGLALFNDEPTSFLNKKLDLVKTHMQMMNFDDALKGINDIAMSLIPRNSNGWVVRGSLRCLFLQELEYWDDIDVVVDCSKSILLEHLETNGYVYNLNYFDNPKVILENGISVDVWTLKSGESISDELAKYSHTLDMMAFSLKEQKIIDPFCVQAKLISREVGINKMFLQTNNESEIDYAMIKLFYLMLRHELVLDDFTENLLFTKRIRGTVFLSKCCIKLIKELSCLSVDLKERVYGLKESYATTPTGIYFFEHLPVRMQ